ncbi:putative zinc finger CCCH domain-containing protein 22-like [Capsicum annuum]|nr:putative zinc finger CCCH domain-containing protein 22-like [Capsicum annuum]
MYNNNKSQESVEDELRNFMAVGVPEAKNNLVAAGVRLGKNLNARRAKFQDIDQREHIAGDDADDLSIDDSEGDYKLHGKKRKREIGGKKDVHANKPAKTTEKVENKRTSAKINYNALQKLVDELKHVPVEAEVGGPEPKACATGDSAENLENGFHELEQENEYVDDDYSYRDNDDDSYYGCDGTGYYNNSEDFDADY